MCRKYEKNELLSSGQKFVLFWRRRRDLNSCTGYPTYTLSRGASSPLEYFCTSASHGFTNFPYHYTNFLSICQVFLEKKLRLLFFIQKGVLYCILSGFVVYCKSQYGYGRETECTVISIFDKIDRMIRLKTCKFSMYHEIVKIRRDLWKPQMPISETT